MAEFGEVLPLPESLDPRAGLLLVAPWSSAPGALLPPLAARYSSLVAVVDERYRSQLRDSVGARLAVVSGPELLADCRSRGALAPRTAYLVFPELYETTLHAGIEILRAGAAYRFSALPLLLCMKYRPQALRAVALGSALGWRSLGCCETGPAPVGAGAKDGEGAARDRRLQSLLKRQLYLEQLELLDALWADAAQREPLCRRTRSMSARRDLLKLICLEGCINLHRRRGHPHGFSLQALRQRKGELASLAGEPAC